MEIEKTGGGSRGMDGWCPQAHGSVWVVVLRMYVYTQKCILYNLLLGHTVT